jgi:hypothetical protein
LHCITEPTDSQRNYTAGKARQKKLPVGTSDDELLQSFSPNDSDFDIGYGESADIPDYSGDRWLRDFARAGLLPLERCGHEKGDR